MADAGGMGDFMRTVEEMVELYGEYPGLSTEVITAFTISLNKHIVSVREAGRRIGVYQRLLDIHDWSKWEWNEFPGYALHFHGGGAPQEFAKAWLHHIHLSPHHWQHFMFSDSYSPKDSEVENGCIEMPQHFALEMVADWLGASFAYTGSWDMSEWLAKNWGKIKVHSKTREYLKEVLIDLDYRPEEWKQGEFWWNTLEDEVDGAWFSACSDGDYSATVAISLSTDKSCLRNRHWEVRHTGRILASGYTYGSKKAYDLCEQVMKG